MCYKNWDASSSEMETDIILEGFKQAEQVHGVHYIHFVGDGDVTHTVQLHVDICDCC